MGAWVRVGPVRDFPEGRGRAVEVDGRKVAVFRTGERFVAVSDTCPHMGASLADGTLDRGQVECWQHGWRFDATTGESDSRTEARLTVYETRVDGPDLFLREPEPAAAAGAETPPEDEWVAWDPDRHLRRRGPGDSSHDPTS